MKKVLFGTVLLFCFAVNTNAQKYNKWSIDLGAGVHEIINPLSPGYSTGILSLGQASLGVRYMFNEKFGMRLNFGYNEFKDGKNSLPFKANYYRTTLEGVVNAGNILNFSSWTKRLNLLVHGGFGLSSLRTITPINNGKGTQLLNIMAGFTPQYKLSNRFSLFLDASAIFHDYQKVSYDGAPNTGARTINASIFTVSIGVNISLGEHKENADFLKSDDVIVNNELNAIKKRLENAENEIASLKIKKTEINKTELVQELDNRYAKKDQVSNNKYANVVTSSNVGFIRELLNSGYINVYFDVNKSTVQKGSLNSVNYLKQFMNDNPTVTAVLIGYADETGKENYNLKLSKKRAKKVYDILISTGVNPDRLSYAGGGEDRSVTKEARQFARKVIFKIN